MKKLFGCALAALLAAPAWAAGSGVVIAVGPQQPAVASVLLGGQVAPTVHKQSADFSLIATALTRGDVEGAADATPAAGSISGGGKALRNAAPNAGR